MAILIAIPLFSFLIIIQSAVLSWVPLVYGTADLILLAIVAWALQKRVNTAWHWSIVGGLIYSFVSGLPTGVPLVGYLFATGLALRLRRRVWQTPVLAMFLTIFISTVVINLINFTALKLIGNPIVLLEILELITLPSLLLNLVLALPAYILFADLAKWLHPEGLEM